MPTTFPHYGPADIVMLEENQAFYDDCERSLRKLQERGALFQHAEVRDLVDAACAICADSRNKAVDELKKALEPFGR